MNLFGAGIDRDRLYSIIQTVSRIACLIALAYIGRELFRHWSAVSDWRPGRPELLRLLAIIAVYSAGLFLLAENWHQVLAANTGKRVSRTKTFPSFTQTQIAKYLPGNVFHYVGRHIALAKSGYTHKILAASSVFEIVVLIAGAACLAAAVLWAVPLPPTGEFNIIVNAAAPLFLLCVLAALFGGCVFVLIRSREDVINRTRLWSALLSFAASVAFFTIQGGVFVAICSLLSVKMALYGVAIANIAWIAGFVTPGSPGGLGSREIILLLLLKPVFPEADALIAIALFRITTVVGDSVMYFLGLIWFSRGMTD